MVEELDNSVVIEGVVGEIVKEQSGGDRFTKNMILQSQYREWNKALIRTEKMLKINRNECYENNCYDLEKYEIEKNIW